MKNMYLIVFLIFSQLAIAQNLQQQDPADQPAQNNQPSQEVMLPQQILEEITVRGNQTFISIRNQIERAEDNMYTLFNELNSNDDFDIFCRNRNRSSHIAQRECEPMFLTKARRANSVFALRAMRDGFSATEGFSGAAGDFSAANGSPMFQFGLDMIMSESALADGEMSKFEALQAEMLRIASENPEYLEALMQVGKLKQLLSDERIKKFGVP